MAKTPPMSEQAATETAAAATETATPAPAAAKRRKAPGPVPDSPVPMCWVSAKDSPEPYLINVADLDPAKHTRIEE